MMNLFQIADELGLDRRSNLRSIRATEIKSWAEDAGSQLFSAEVAREYFLMIVEQIGRVASECRSARLQGLKKGEKLNYDDLIFLEPHIGYQAGRKKGDEQRALKGLKKILSASLEQIARPGEEDYVVENLTRLNQFFQAMVSNVRYSFC
jgi:CRISPR/Cas system CSM-associated protein Csm2 small subunit